jgi:DNA-binding beta-propeller fold protein YncE
MWNHQAIVFFLMMLVAPLCGIDLQSGSSPENTNEDSSQGLRFVRQFASAQDVQRDSHQILNRSLDIIAGPKTPGPTIEALQQPYGVTTDSTHRIFVTDIKAKVVHIFDVANSKHSLLRAGETLRSPLGVAVDREGNVYVSDSALGAVLVYDSGGKFSHYLKPTRGNESYFQSPRGIAIVDGPRQHIYVCDTNRHMVIVFDPSGQVLSRLGVRGGGREPGEFRYPTQVAAARDEIAVLDTGNFRVQVFDTQGHFLRKVSLAFASGRTGLAMDNDNNIYVSDPDLNHLDIFNRDGKLVYEFGESGKEPGQFQGMSGLWLDSGQCLYVADMQNKRVQLFQINSHSIGCQL